jgi:hypothetical protein
MSYDIQIVSIVEGERNCATDAVSAQRMASQEYSETLPKSRRKIYLKAVQGEASPRMAIKSNCQFCMGYENVEERIRACAVFKCPLWPYRPYQQTLRTAVHRTPLNDG